MKKYQEIYKQLKEAIRSGQYPIDSFLPSETKLAKHYQASRETIRKALEILESDGLIKKGQGRPSQVLRQQHYNFPVSQLTSYQEVTRAQGISSKTQVLALERLLVDDKLMAKTQFPVGKQVWRVRRQRTVNGRASVLDTDYLLVDQVRHLTRDIAQGSIYHYLEEELGLDIAYAEKEITIVPVTDQDKIWLDTRQDRHVVSVQSRVYLSNGLQFQFTESRHLLEKFHFVDYAQRKKAK